MRSSAHSRSGVPKRGRVLCVTSNFPRWEGDSTTPFVFNLAKDLQSLGWEVDVLAPHASGAATVETLDGVIVERFHYLPEAWETVCYGGGALVNLQRRRRDLLKVVPLVGAQWWGIVRRLVRRYDILHTHWAVPQGFTAALSGGLIGVPQVLTVHGEELFVLHGRFVRPFTRFALEHADAVTTNSDSTEKAAWALAPKMRDVRRIPMGVSTDMRAQPDLVARLRDRHRRPEGPLLLYVGRLVEEKGVEDLICAVAQMRDTLPGVTLMIAGAGPERDHWETLSRQLRIEDRVSFVGWVPDSDLASYYSAADVFVAPSRRGRGGWIEGQGLTPIEAMVMGTPVIATALGGTVDSVKHERTGLLIPERTPRELASSVIRLVNDAPLAARLCAEARSMAVARFSRQRSAQEFSGLFAEIC